MRVFPSLGLLLLLPLTQASGCVTGRQPAVRPLGGLVVICEPADAEIYVDDRFYGTAASQRGRPLALPPGRRRIEIRRQGFFAHFAELELVKGVRQRLEVKLRKQPF